MLLVGCCIFLPMYLRNVWYTGYLPFNMNQPYDRFGNIYNISRVLDDAGNFVQQKYEQYSVLPLPLFGFSADTSIAFVSHCSLGGGLHRVLRLVYVNYFPCTSLQSYTNSCWYSKYISLQASQRTNDRYTLQAHISICRGSTLVVWCDFLYELGVAFASLSIYVPDAPK